MREKLERLTRLAGSDPGFYVLALHAFVEHYLRDVVRASDAERFSDLVWDYRAALLEESGGEFVEGLNCLTGLARQHRFTNAVRHAFHELDPEEAAAATHLFIVFCTLVGIDALPEVRTLQRSLDGWHERNPLSEESGVLRAMQEELSRLQEQNEELLGRLSEYHQKEHTLAELENRIERISLELEMVRGRVREKDSRLDELRHERAALRDERRMLHRQMGGYRDLERYIRTMGRLSIYTRTRLDYERTLTRLTAEQEDAAARVGEGVDTLIRGTAGTGKSLVLIEALRRTLEVGELDFRGESRGDAGESGAASGAPEQRALLLTFTRTLVKYQDYVARVLGLPALRSLVKTVDTFILERLQRIDSSLHFDFTCVHQLVQEVNTTDFLTNAELAAEIESFLFANVVTREEYLHDIIPRVGMRRRLGRARREVVWAIRDAVAARMRENKAFSRNYARIFLLEYLGTAEPREAAALRDVRTIFLDETQDLTSGDLMALKGLATGALVMAADIQQSIYGVSSPFVRAGIQITGRTRVLHTNFRNTRQIAEAALRFAGGDMGASPADGAGGAGADSGAVAATGTGVAAAANAAATSGAAAFREGADPEVYTAEHPGELLPLMVARVRLFLDHLGYERETLCILTPHNEEVANVSHALEEEGIASAVITTPDFSFTDGDAVRISTLHSSKGLDFPVVMLYLPYIRRREQFDTETTERLVRNLVYVGLTRAMENLSVFVVPREDQVLQDVVRALRHRDVQGARDTQQ